jgi:hypothetical protein
MTRRILMAAAGLLMVAGLARAEASASETDPKQAGANKNPPARKGIYDPDLRMARFEDLRNIEKEWERIWSVDQPSRLLPERLRRVDKPGHLPPWRVHGGIQ